MKVLVTYRKGQKQLKKIAKHPESTLGRPPIYDRAYPEKLSTASPGNPVGITKPSSFSLFVQQNNKSLEESTNLKSQGNLLLDIFGKKSMRKIRSQSKLASKLNAIHIAQTVPQFKWYASLWGMLNCRQCENLFEKSIFLFKNFRWKIQEK